MRNFKGKTLTVFWLKIAAVFLIMSMVAGVFICFMYPYNMRGHLGAYRDKLNTIKDIETPKTLFVGGSSVLFGVNAEYYEKLSGERSVNMGLHALRSPDIYLSCIEPYIHEKDTVVIALEYSSYRSENAWKEYDDVGLDVAQLSGEYYRVVPSQNKGTYFFHQFLRSFERVSVGLYNETIKEPLIGTEKVYLRDNITAYGDFKPEFATNTQNPSPRREPFEFSEEAIQNVFKYAERYKEKGAEVFIAFAPCYCTDIDAQKMKRYNQVFQKYFGEKVLGSPSDWMLQDGNLFYDTAYHLIREQALKHTEYIYDLIQEKNKM